MKRRELMLAALAAPAVGLPLLARAHHGWSSFDQERPIYLEGRVTRSRWQNPHAELELEVPAGLKVPAGLVQRAIPAQTAPVDGKALLAKAVVPNRKDRKWEIELAPLTRMNAWNVAEIKVGDSLSVVGFIFKEEKGDPSCAPSICSSAIGRMGCAPAPHEAEKALTGLFQWRGRRPQLASAANARAVMSSTLPVPLMARYFGAAAGSALAQLP